MIEYHFAIMFKFIGNLLDSNEREIKKFEPITSTINSLEGSTKKLTDKKLREKTSYFRKKIKEGEDLEDLLPEAFATVREAARRTIGQRHFDVQLVGGMVLHQGKIAEMKTGEGKTLVATLPLYLNALTEKGTHLITVNDYLARRDAEWMGPIYHFLGLTVGVINHEQSYVYDPNPQTPEIANEEVIMDPESSLSPESEGLGVGKYLREVSRKEAYQADITYGTNNEFGFDYLRDNMAWEKNHISQRELNYAIVDEVDSILIDEARTPLIISAPAEESTEKYYQFASLVETLNLETDYVLDEKLRTANLTEIGISKIERTLGIDNLYEKDFSTLHLIEQSLKAKTLYHKDQDYVVKDGQVIIVDEFTGRLLPGRRYSEGLHQAIEAKEGVQIQKESKTLATVTFQNYFRLYEKLAGMTGTAATSAEEFHKVYKLEVIVVPTNKPMVRHDFSDAVYKTERAKYEAIAREIEEKHKKGQPVLLGTTSIEKNELISSLLKRKKVTHEVLNAKNHEREAQIIANAGQRGAATIATNIAGRGVDIKLGEGVVKLGGLHIIGTERHEARRIDNQLRGRSGRQGDPGSSRFYASLQDDIMRLFGGDQIANLMNTLRLPEDVPIENTIVSKAIENAQSKVEGHNFDIRKHLVEYDDVLNKQREIVYSKRKKIIEDVENKDSEEGQRKLKEIILNNIDSEIENIVNLSAKEESETDTDKAMAEFATIIPFDESSQKQIKKQVDESSDKEKAIDLFKKLARDVYEAREKQMGPELMAQIEKIILLSTIDTLWTSHLEDISDLREGIGLRGYAARDPLVEYKSEAFNLFESLVNSIDYEVVHRIFKVQLAPQEQQGRPHQHEHATTQTSTSSSEAVSSKIGSTPVEAQPVPSIKKKIGRNDPCPCGSGLKYKKCGLINSPSHKG